MLRPVATGVPGARRGGWRGRCTVTGEAVVEAHRHTRATALADMRRDPASRSAARGQDDDSARRLVAELARVSDPSTVDLVLEELAELLQQRARLDELRAEDLEQRSDPDAQRMRALAAEQRFLLALIERLRHCLPEDGPLDHTRERLDDLARSVLTHERSRASE
jgi:hypothetical protein